ncbi:MULTISPECIES: site-specific integrase [Streptococcus]|uniref:Integrase n=1 Tax=Streptococcus thermophilus M17PTZA496 TaxID=1433289 RepID=A0A0E2Q6J3_STRTR|nr:MULTISPECIES: site-specific integrase [Streptococcus]ETW91860.1 integrase [Streptococcus thermophilus M17PTZA496]EWM59836.1 integrase [Streptococcus thermophilus TH1477]MBW7802136.1 site-specific integrase [Streptococcus thermophilus]MBW7821734.1 site-specific integrase [Streptococcus thermophilus]MCB4949244.1 site-specific integrase [Streptococcus mutans]
MTITKTKNGTYRLKIYIPIEARMPLGIVNNSYFDKRFKTRKEARQTEIDLLTKLNQIEDNEFIGLNKQEILFKDFYEQIWWEAYKAGQTTSTTRPPSKSTVVNTKTCFEKHLLPLLGNYTIQFLNQNKQVILNLMTAKANEYANFKTLRSYVISIFDWAEELEYIETNRLAKTLRRIKATKKIQLSEARRDEDLYLTQEQLQAWFTAFKEDLDNGKISLKDYVLFYLTFFLGDRKSETYALQWKHIDFSKAQIQLIQALDRYGEVKSTKGNKKTIFSISNDLLELLSSWKEQQKYELARFGIMTNPEQFVFTYIDTKGNVNKPLHADYLNNKMKTIRKRHPELAHATPHKLRHTGATLAKEAGMSLEAISEALTHSDTGTTQIYVNTSNVVPMAVGEFALKSLKQ